MVNTFDVIFDTVGAESVTAIPIENFRDLDELAEFVKTMDDVDIGTFIRYEVFKERSGVYVEVYDRDSCPVRNIIDLLN